MGEKKGKETERERIGNREKWVRRGGEEMRESQRRRKASGKRRFAFILQSYGDDRADTFLAYPTSFINHYASILT